MPDYEKSLTEQLWMSSFQNNLTDSVNNQNKLFSRFAHYQHQQHRSKHYHETYNSPQVISTTDFSNATYVEKFLKRAVEFPIYMPGFETIMLIDISTLTTTKFQTIILELHAKPIKTKESTQSIMKRYAKQHYTFASFNKFVAQKFKYSQRIPLIIGDQIFVPNKGYSKKPASWIGLHLIASIEENRRERLTYLYGLFNSHIVVPYNQNFSQNYLERVCNLYNAQKALALKAVEPFQKTLSLQPLVEFKHIINKMINEMDITRKAIDFNDYINYFIHDAAQEVLTQITTHDNPYLEDIIAYFEKSK